MRYADKWRAIAAATGPADRAAAEEGVRLAYGAAGLPAPDRIIWADSPLAGVNAVRALEAPGRSVRDDVRTRPWADERRRVHDELGPGGWTALWTGTGALLWDGTRALAERIRTGVVDALLEKAPDDAAGRAGEESRIRGVLLDAVLGQHDAAWLAAFDGRSDRLTGLARVAEHAGWWWPFEKAVVICERPLRLHRDEAGRLDNGDGPALVFPDGFALYAWRGMPVPAEFLRELTALTPERIRDEENAELRRVMLEYYGYDRYLAESGAQPVHRDETGILWRIALADDEDVVMVEVVNSTPEPDGSHRTYWLRVPPTTRTAREGVAWTFGMHADVYEPAVQT
ncbi:DUF6745 domain-containing protein [Streptomyces pristinaespiralis]|uniref:DUF6745 domain-containing protein n=2 Tax=Streptomyces pristinaespiralis TaxID=38300 RepID=B5H4J5_STRE2|nr:hypothetical protein [Streptomyces pristinaespiralis]ALC19272.1 hypothetical protein SPRI_0966 [Streptomyces pristinaespiralis]EDY61756.2 conserved hypothetical protein [Streptomyces pristinaespiralis ATCC 25486]QMU17664.1 hypothetical protein H3L99_32110 [Streptomyces pristinaespiralis]